MAVRRKKCGPGFSVLVLPLVMLAVVLCFMAGLSHVNKGKAREDRQRLEEVLKEAAVACYSVEGSYPPSLAYLEEHYGVQIDRRRFTVRYAPVAENLMPDITVLEK